MTQETPHILPQWAPRLRKVQLKRLYETAGRGIVDEDLVNDVGFSLLARVESMLAAQEAKLGRARCPVCRAAVPHEHELLRCPQCDWQCPWPAYHKTLKYKHLGAGGMKEFLLEFAEKFPKATTPGARLILIDTLIHRYHWGAGRPGSGGLIEGKMNTVMAFLDELSYGERMPPEVEAVREEWRQQWRGHKWKARIETTKALNRQRKKA